MPTPKSAFDDTRSPSVANAVGTGSVERDRDLNAATRRQDRAVTDLEAQHQRERHAGGRYDHPRTVGAVTRHHVHEHQHLAEKHESQLNTIEAWHARQQRSSQEMQRRHEAERRELEERQRREAW
jgi:hypothetical protein